MIGQSISHYKVLEKIGEGGMGEVYLAEDTNLGRQVALKFLPEYLKSDIVAHKRFLREARSAAVLDHPFICKIYETGDAEGHSFIAMEYVEGLTLTARLKKGRVSLKEALQIGSEVAEALEEAHRKGVVHRDLKPSNIMLTAGDHAKVMDFGLAKRLTEEDGTEQEITAALTREGTTLGTPAYMSPEQIRGKTVDTRTDIFSFGIILYELLAGVHPFRKPKQAETTGAILHEEPLPLSRFSEDTSEVLQHTVFKMLAKDPEERYQSVREVRTNLKKLSETITSPTPLIQQEYKRKRWLVAALALPVAIATIAAAVYFLLPDYYSREEASGPLQIRPLTTDGEWKEFPQLSPDGKFVVYQTSKRGWRRSDICVMPTLGSSESLQLADSTLFEGGAVWSPDGTRVAFLGETEERKAAVYLMPAPIRGRRDKLLDVRARLKHEASLSWSKDDRWLAVADVDENSGPSRIELISLETKEEKPSTNPPRGIPGDFCPSFSPDVSQIAFVRKRDYLHSELWVQSVNANDERQLASAGDEVNCPLTWTSDGREIVYSAASRLYRIPSKGGTPQDIATEGRSSSPNIRENRLVYVEDGGESTDIWRIHVPESNSEMRPERVIKTNPKYDDEQMEVSPDGQKIAFYSDRSGAAEIWIANADGSDPIPLTDLGRLCQDPSWSPDSKSVAFRGPSGIYIVDTDGGEPQYVTRGSGPSWSHDGQWIYFGSDKTGSWQVWKVPVQGGEADQVTKDGGMMPKELEGYLYYVKRSRSPSLVGVWRVSLQGGEEERILKQFVFVRHWDIIGDRLYFVQYENWWICMMDVNTKEVTRIYPMPDETGLMDVAVAPDEKWIYYAFFKKGTHDLMLVENFR